MVGLVLLFGMVAAGALMLVVVGGPMLDALQSHSHGEKSQQDLQQFDSDLASLGYQEDATGTVSLGDLDGDLITDGELEVTVSDGYASDTESIELQTLVATDEGGNEFAYQAGGIWQLHDDHATAVSDPDLRYYTETAGGEQVGRLDISPLTLEGSVSSGEHTVQEVPNQDSDFESLGDELDYISYVTLEVSESQYHHGWYDFLKDEFNAVERDTDDCDTAGPLEDSIICHDESDKTVTVVATVDGETSLANLVDIEPMLYGGLYLEGDSAEFDSSLTVKSYGGHDASMNDVPDFFLADYDEYRLKNVDIEGVPIVNGELVAPNNPMVSPITYGVSISERGVDVIDEDEGVYQLNSNDPHGKSLAAELSEPYDGIDSIDNNLESVMSEYLAGESSAGGDVTAGLYYGETGITSLDSSRGDIHVAVDEDLDLTNVDVHGDNQTNVYVDGDVDLTNVEVEPDDRANSLWIYATSDATITIDDSFQGVVYAPGSNINITEGTSVDGAVVAGEPTGSGISDGVEINFDRSLRTDTPLTDDDEDLSVEYGTSRAPIDATFVLDRSGSMGPHNPDDDRNPYNPNDEVDVGESWEPIPTDEPFRNMQGGFFEWNEHDVQVRNGDGDTRRLEYREFANPSDWDEARVHPDDHGLISDNAATLGLYNHPGNDPDGERVEATDNFIGLMNESNGDRVGVYDFDREGHVLHSLDGDLDEAQENVVGYADGGTNMAAGFELALDDYENYEEDGQDRVAILLSDGQNNYDSDDDAMDAQVERANELGVTLHTVGLGGLEHDPIPEDQLEAWAEETGGSFHRTNDADELFDLFESIAKEEVNVDAEPRVEITVTNDRETTSGYALSISERTVEIDS